MAGGAHFRQARRSPLRSLIEWILIVAVVVGGLQLVRAFVVEPFFVPTGSMETTIMPGDTLLAEKLSLNLGHDVERGDIVVFENPDPSEGHEVLVKRVIATEGQTVSLAPSEDGVWRVSVDGQVLDEPYALGSSYALDDSVTFPLTVPDGCVWLMGDNRENSADSRVFGPVDVDSLIGVVVWRYWPLDRFGGVE